jgi:hypothetical protein
LASIGLTGGMTGRSTRAFCPDPSLPRKDLPPPTC